jgi:PAS domain S-box-containing protein
VVPQHNAAQNPAERQTDVEVMLDAITDYGIMKMDLAGTILSWSAGAHTLMGYTDSEIIGQHVSVLYAEDDRNSGLVERDLAAAHESGRVDSEGWRLRLDGGRFRAGIVVTAIRDETGAVVGYGQVIRDLAAEQQRAYSMFHGLLEAAPDAIIIVGTDGRIMLVNAQADRIFGHKREELVGKDVEILMPERFRAKHTRHRKDYLIDPVNRRMGVGIDLVALHRDGTEFPIEVSLSPLYIEGVLYVSAAVRDVTERREYEQRLRRQHEEIMELSTPVIQVWEKVLTLPLIGTLDSLRASRLTEGLLQRISETQAEVVIVDISGVPTIDTQVAQHLLRTVQAAALMGATSIMCGVRPETAQAMVHLGIDIGQLLSRGTLQDALQLALTLLAERVQTAKEATDALQKIGSL